MNNVINSSSNYFMMCHSCKSWLNMLLNSTSYDIVSLVTGKGIVAQQIPALITEIRL